MTPRPAPAVPDAPLSFPLRASAERFPDKVAVVAPEEGGVSRTYAWLEDRSSRLAGSLAAVGVRPGDRVGIRLANGVGYIVSFYAILKAGGVVVPLSTRGGERELLHQLRVTGASGLVASDEAYDVAARLPTCAAALRVLVSHGAGEPPRGTIRLSELVEGNRLLDRSGGIDPAAPAVLPFSSGTTGLPKAVTLTHRNLLCNLYQVREANAVGRNDVFLNQLPFFHIYGMTVLMGSAILAGATQVVASRFRPVDDFLGLFDRYRPTLFFTVPPILHEICRHPRARATDFRGLRYVNSGGAPLSRAVQEEFTRVTGVPVIQGYGLTESSPTTHVVPPDRPRAGSVGVPVPLTEDRIVDPDTGRDLPAGDVGELWVRGPQVMAGYHGEPEATARTLVGGWLRTGDLARKDGDGFVEIVDRLKELIKTRGFAVAPAEIEGALMRHPAVRDAAVVGEPHPRDGEVPVAYVALAEGADATGADLIEFAADGFAGYKRLARVAFVGEIPRGPSGKILRKLLKESPAGQNSPKPGGEGGV